MQLHIPIATLRRRAETAAQRLAASAPRAFEPLDYAARVINGKSDLPPLHLRMAVGPVSAFETSSTSMLAFLSAACAFSSEQRMLDIGCGCGSLPLQLVGFFSGPGSYTGVDVDKVAIKWAQRHISSRDVRIGFQAVNVHNGEYHASGAVDAADFVFPFDDRSFDVIVVKSVFTHMRPNEVSNYIGEIGRLLAPGGHCVMTFFLRNSFRSALIARGASLRFPYDQGYWAFDDEEVPERAIAYDESYIRTVLEDAGLTLARPIVYAHQDVLVATRPSASGET